MRKKIAIGIGVFLALILVGPFLVPVPPLEGTVPPEQLADPDSEFVEVQAGDVMLDVHIKRESGGGEHTFLLVHGFGGSTFSWREVIEPLAQFGTVIAYDRPGYGLTERPLEDEWQGYEANPYTPEAQVEIAINLLDAFDVEQAIIVGHSAGGTIAAKIALAHPDRVEGLILVDAAIYRGGGTPRPFVGLAKTPQMDQIGPLFVRWLQNQSANFLRQQYHDPDEVTEQVLEGYTRPEQVNHWDQALWEYIRVSVASDLPASLAQIESPTLVISGAHDTVVPPEESQQTAEALPNAIYTVIEDAGHLPMEEEPEAFMNTVSAFVEDL